MTELETVRSGHVVIGVDTHKHIHVAAVTDSVGGILATLTITTDTAGFKQLLGWAASFGNVIAFGIEGTGSYGAALTSFVRRHGHKSSRSPAPIGGCADSTGSPTPLTRKTPPGPCSPDSRPRSRRPRTGSWR